MGPQVDPWGGNSAAASGAASPALGVGAGGGPGPTSPSRTGIRRTMSLAAGSFTLQQQQQHLRGSVQPDATHAERTAAAHHLMRGPAGGAGSGGAAAGADGRRGGGKAGSSAPDAPARVGQQIISVRAVDMQLLKVGWGSSRGRLGLAGPSLRACLKTFLAHVAGWPEGYNHPSLLPPAPLSFSRFASASSTCVG